MSAAPVSVIGLGALGTAVTNVLLTAGHAVTVWNRTSARAEAAEHEGARRAGSAAEAAAASPVILLCLTDYDAVGEVLDAVLPVAAGRTLVVLSTGSPDEARRAARLADQAGVQYLDVGLQTTLEAIGGPAATFPGQR